MFGKMRKVYGGFFRAGAQGAMAYRLNFMGFFIGESLYCFVMYFMWKAVFMASGESTFMGFTLVDMTMYVFLSNIVGFFTGTDSTRALAEEIRDGNIIMRMIKPVNVDLSLLANEVGNNVVYFAFIFAPVMLGVEIYRYCALGYVAFDIVSCLIFILSMILSYILSFYLNLIFGYLAFWLMNIWGFDILKGSIIKFFSGAMIPLAFFPGIVRDIFELLPFASMVYKPTMIYMGKISGVNILIALGEQIIWILVFYGIAKLLWRFAQKRLAVQGG
jgi:ABC-2 type transport system permease protein